MRAYSKRFAIVCGCLLVACSVYSQGRQAESAVDNAKDTEREVLKIARIEGLGEAGIAKTPEYETSAPQSQKPRGDWGRIRVTYHTAPKWIDELAFKYYVLTQVEQGGKKQYSLFAKTVRYIDVARGKDHYSSVYLHPSTLRRYGQVVAVAVEVERDGRVIGVAGESEKNSRLPVEWWKKSEVLDHPNLKKMENYLLDEVHSPFALINIDEQEASR